MKSLVSHSISSPNRVATRPLPVAATDHARRAPELAAGIGLREALAMLRGCGLRRSEDRRSRWAT